jgi:hypothetical protein
LNRFSGIDVNEILRARWIQFDKYYEEEFGEEGIPKEPYIYDFFKNYQWKDVEEDIKNSIAEILTMKLDPKNGVLLGLGFQEKTKEILKGRGKKIIIHEHSQDNECISDVRKNFLYLAQSRLREWLLQRL